LTVTFDQPISIIGVPATVFTLAGSNAQLVISGVTVFTSSITITFSGPATQFGSLPDGNYTLQIDASRIIGGGQLDGNGDGFAGDDCVFSFHRLFGDSNGDQRVDGNDFAICRTSFAQSTMTFDFNNDGITNAIDLVEFRKRFGLHIYNP